MTDGNKICNRRGEKEEFDQRKLYASIYYPAREDEYSEKEAEELAEEVAEQVAEWIGEHEDNVVTSKEIRDKTKELLEERDDGVAFLYDTHLDIN
jgi:transcriptional regulator NrdR family protein